MYIRSLVVVWLTLLYGCGGKSDAPVAQSPGAQPGLSSAGKPAPAVDRFSDRKGELVNPDEGKIQLWYLSLTGTTPSFDTIVERDLRVLSALPSDKPAQKEAVRSELEQNWSSAENARVVLLPMAAQLSAYDPATGAFMVRALSPSSVLSFGSGIKIRFLNAKDAQIWAVPESDVQSIVSKIQINDTQSSSGFRVPVDESMRSSAGNEGYPKVTINALLRVIDVIPEAVGGTIITEVVEYEVISPSGVSVGHVQVARAGTERIG